MKQNTEKTDTKVKTYPSSNCTPKKVHKQDDTEYLTANPNNKAHLDKSIAQGKRGEFCDCELFN